MSLCLLIDTTLQGVALGLGRLGSDAELLWVGVNPRNENSSSSLSGLLKEGLEKTSASQNDLLALTVGVGPGSFTGIKVGLAYAYGLMRAAKTPLRVIEVSPLKSLAKRHFEASKKSTALFLPATRTQGFLALATKEENTVESIFIDLLEQDLWQTVEAVSEVKLLKPWPLLSQVLEEKGIKSETLAISDVCNESIYGMWEQVQKLWPNAFAEELPKPLYMRKSTAEEQIGLTRG